MQCINFKLVSIIFTHDCIDCLGGVITMKKEFDNFTIEYTNDDLSYIGDLIQSFLISHKRIMQFFDLNSLDKKVEIKIWNDMEAYEKYIKGEMKRIFDVSIKMHDWEVGRAITTKKESQIHLLSYKERLKRKGHSGDTLDSVIKVISHEFVHTCHAQYKHYQTTLTWFGEALATVLADQYSNQKLVLDCTLEELLNGKTNYVRYYTLGKYIFETYKKNEILKLASNNELLKEMTPILFEEAKQWLDKKYDNSVVKGK